MDKKFYFGMSVDDVALDGWSTADNFAHLVSFFQEQAVHATFFVVPIDEVTDKPFMTLDSRYLDIIKDAHAKGFCFGQHGLRHNRFELGVPPMMVLDLPHEAENKRWAAENADFLAKDHSVENCRARLRQGRKILEDAFGFPVNGFRAHALQESPGMFQAIKEEGYTFDSSCCLQETGWDYILDKLDVPPRDITRERWMALNRKGYGLSFSLTCDYTWFLTPEKYDLVMKLAKHDFQQCLAADVPFVTVCHVDPVHQGEGIRFLTEFYAYAREEAARQGREISFETLENIAKHYKIEG